VVYHYDTDADAIPEYNSRNNRLMWYETIDTAPMIDQTLAKTYYVYSYDHTSGCHTNLTDGNPTRIITETFAGGGGEEQSVAGGSEEQSSTLSEGTVEQSETSLSPESGAIELDPSGGGTQAAAGGGGSACGLNKKLYTSVRLRYANNGRAVTFVHAESWCAAAGTTCAPATTNQYAIAWAREFRYDGARARYMNRKLNAIQLRDFGQLVDEGTVWTDYDGDSTYGDFTVFAGEATSTDAYEPGLWRNVGGVSSYLHSDHLGTLRTTSNGVTGFNDDLRVFTAFGERVAGSADRHGYVGAHGYQSTLDSGAEVFPFQHVGARYYDPSSGRFLQRDPIGIHGGVNVYEYVKGTPTEFADPIGFGVGLFPGPQRKPWDPMQTAHDRERERQANPAPQPHPSPPAGPPGFMDTPAGVFVEIEHKAIIVGIVIPVAIAGDLFLILTGVPWWYDGNGSQFMYCTRQVTPLLWE